MENVFGEGMEKFVLRNALKIDVNGIKVVLGIAKVFEALFEVMLNRRFADAPFAVEQQRVVMNRLENAVDESADI